MHRGCVIGRSPALYGPSLIGRAWLCPVFHPRGATMPALGNLSDGELTVPMGSRYRIGDSIVARICFA